MYAHDENDWADKHDRNLGNHLCCCVDPDIVHVASAFSHEDWLFTLENNNSWKEIEEHLHDAQEVNCTNHRGLVHSSELCWAVIRIGTRYFTVGIRASVIIELPEDWNQENKNDQGRTNFRTADTGLTLRKNPRTIEQLLELSHHACMIGGFAFFPVLGHLDFDHAVFDLNAVFN